MGFIEKRKTIGLNLNIWLIAYPNAKFEVLLYIRRRDNFHLAIKLYKSKPSSNEVNAYISLLTSNMFPLISGSFKIINFRHRPLPPEHQPPNWQPDEPRPPDTSHGSHHSPFTSVQYGNTRLFL